MGAAAYNRGSRMIRERTDRETAARRTYCAGKMRNGPAKNYVRCPQCGRVDFEKYEGDTCGREVPS